MRTHLFLFLLGVALPVWAQALPDSGLPDGSVGEGSAQGTTEENDPQGGPCLDSRECAQGFACVGARCVPSKPKSVGCASTPAAVLVSAAILLALRRRRG